jgi:Flp pilus assembly pilin Flp
MAKLFSFGVRFWRDRRGQDMIEYALLAGAMAVVVAGVLPPSIVPSVSTIWTHVMSCLSQI